VLKDLRAGVGANPIDEFVDQVHRDQHGTLDALYLEHAFDDVPPAQEQVPLRPRQITPSAHESLHDGAAVGQSALQEE
jgi:hypothetical protein